MLKNILNIIFGYKLLINPLILLNAINFNKEKSLNYFKHETEIIVSLYANENNLNNVYLTVYSLFNQSILPDKIVLWLSDEYELNELPYSITKYIKNGLEIKFVKDKESFTNSIYALKEYKDSIIIAADSNIFYPKKWLELLYHSYIANPSDIHVHRALKTGIENSKLFSYKNWERYVNDEKSSYKYVPESAGGILYPPNCFVSDIFREDIYRKKANISWNIWCWIVALLSNRKIRVVKNHIDRFACLNIFNCIKKEIFILKNYSIQDNNIKIILEYYRQNIYNKIT